MDWMKLKQVLKLVITDFEILLNWFWDADFAHFTNVENCRTLQTAKFIAIHRDQLFAKMKEGLWPTLFTSKFNFSPKIMTSKKYYLYKNAWHRNCPFQADLYYILRREKMPDSLQKVSKIWPAEWKRGFSPESMPRKKFKNTIRAFLIQCQETLFLSLVMKPI